MVEQAFLNRLQFLHVLQGGGPARMGIPLPGSNPAAWRIHQNSIKLCLGRQSRSSIPGGHAIIENLCSRRAQLQPAQPPFSAVAGPNAAFAGHQVGEMQSLAAFACTGIPPDLAGPRVAKSANDLRTDVLQFEFGSMKFRSAEQVL